jgi:hypothetical protein
VAGGGDHFLYFINFCGKIKKNGTTEVVFMEIPVITIAKVT